MSIKHEWRDLLPSNQFLLGRLGLFPCINNHVCRDDLSRQCYQEINSTLLVLFKQKSNISYELNPQALWNPKHLNVHSYFATWEVRGPAIHYQYWRSEVVSVGLSTNSDVEFQNKNKKQQRMPSMQLLHLCAAATSARPPSLPVLAWPPSPCPTPRHHLHHHRLPSQIEWKSKITDQFNIARESEDRRERWWDRDRNLSHPRAVDYTRLLVTT